MPSINDAGLQLIEEFEGCKLTAYQDTGGVWTIGSVWAKFWYNVHMTTQERFWNKVSVRDGGCWEWQGGLKCGYGRVRIGKRPGREYKAHRLAWEFATGQHPGEMHVCHTCDNPKCVNPKHLFLGTHADNMADRQQKGRTIAPCGEQGNSKLTNAAVREIRTSLESARVLAQRFGVSAKTVYRVRWGETWGHLAVN